MAYRRTPLTDARNSDRPRSSSMRAGTVNEPSEVDIIEVDRGGGGGRGESEAGSSSPTL